MKAVKRRPGYTEEQIDKEAVLLRAYGKGTEVLIDRESESAYLYHKDNKLIGSGQRKLHPIPYSPSMAWPLHSSLVSTMVSSTGSSVAECAVLQI